jgi:DNA adenine methylase
MALTRPAFKFHGSKYMLSKWIISHFPPHDCYVEPYGGSAGVLLRKSRSWLEVYNDKDNQVVNFFRVLREQAADLVRVIELTPYAKMEWALSLEDDPDPVESARRFYVRAYMNLAGATAQWNSGWRRQKVVSKRPNGTNQMTPAAITFMNVSHLYAIADRLRGVQIECDDAVEIIQRYDSEGALFYVDPPYVASTRGRWKSHAYRYEMTDEQHCDLATVLRGARGMVAISGYRCELYDDLYPGWLRVDKRVRVNGPGHAVESLWLSPALVSRQLPLFRGMG